MEAVELTLVVGDGLWDWEMMSFDLVIGTDRVGQVWLREVLRGVPDNVALEVRV